MTRRTALALCGAGLLLATRVAADEAQTPACHATKAADAGKLRCSLTGKEVDECCCVETEGGRLHCTLADKDVETCCCTKAEVEG